MDIWNLVAERKIQEAMEEGAFDQLDGAGRPLSLDEDPGEDPAQRMAHRILRNNGLAPAWIEEAREIDAGVRRLYAERAGRGESEFRRLAADLNRRIEAYNLKTPVALTQRLKIRL
ncbi:MAG TPA: DUF1992 domain-containing protein [Candidatus Acidoferrales bacterium]|nr:DUF1992 domain-containing protein [Candidatus Acidoferrales bacterium]